MARDTKKVNLTLNKKTVEALDRMAAAGHRTRTQQIEMLVDEEVGRTLLGAYRAQYDQPARLLPMNEAVQTC